MSTAWLSGRNIPQPWIDWIKSSIGRNFVRPWKKLSKARLSFQKFLGLTLADAVANKNTIWDFKQRWIEAGVMEKLLERFKGHWKDQGLIAQEGKTPEEWEDRAAKLRQKDTDARWAKKGEEVHFGYKNHVKVDEKSKLIEKYEVTDASVHDSQKIGDLVEKGDGLSACGHLPAPRQAGAQADRVHGGSAYRSAQIEKDLKEKAVESRIHEKGYRNRPLTEEQKENNRQKSRVRARIEHVFGYMTNSMGGIFLTCIGMRRKTAAIGLMNLIYNTVANHGPRVQREMMFREKYN